MWVGMPVAEVLGLDPVADVAAIKLVIPKLVKAKALKRVTAQDRTRQERQWYVAGASHLHQWMMMVQYKNRRSAHGYRVCTSFRGGAAQWCTDANSSGAVVQIAGLHHCESGAPSILQEVPMFTAFALAFGVVQMHRFL